MNQQCNIHEQTAADLLRKLKDNGVLIETQSGRGSRSAIFTFIELLEVAESGVIK